MKRYKACFTETCDNYKDRNKFKVTSKNKQTKCELCGEKMQYVCNDKKCYTPLDEPLHGYCDSCLSKKNIKSSIKKKRLVILLNILSI